MCVICANRSFRGSLELLTVIASWPKSGNTWLRSILTCYVKQEFVPLDEMSRIIPTDVAASLWTKYVGFEAHSPDNTYLQRKEFYRLLKSKIGDKNLVLKSHSANIDVRGCSMFDHESVDKFIHVVRNPFDVLPSFANHMNQSIDDAWLAMQNDRLALAATDQQIREMCSSWLMHTSSFLAFQKTYAEKYCMIRYEDLKLKPYTTTKKIVEFLGLDVSEERIVNAVYWSSFKNRKQEEEDSGFKERARAETSFFRKGEIGSFVNDVPFEIRREMAEKYSAICKLLNYSIK